MTFTQISSPPSTQDFTPLSEHEEQTPSTFYGAKPVLYAQQDDLSFVALSKELEEDSAFVKFHAESEGNSGDAMVKNIALWVNSDNLTIFQSAPSPTGVAIPYPSISLHATLKYKSTTEALFLNLSLNDANDVNDMDDISNLELTILPPGHSTSSPQSACIQDIYEALNTCADLHPDPHEDNGDELLQTEPGATGWITADNMHDFMDAEGNFRGTVIGDEAEGLGPGAGTVRPRDEKEDETNGVNGDGGDAKYQRTG